MYALKYSEHGMTMVGEGGAHSQLCVCVCVCVCVCGLWFGLYIRKLLISAFTFLATAQQHSICKYVWVCGKQCTVYPIARDYAYGKCLDFPRCENPGYQRFFNPGGVWLIRI